VNDGILLRFIFFPALSGAHPTPARPVRSFQFQVKFHHRRDVPSSSTDSVDGTPCVRRRTDEPYRWMLESDRRA
jgi:hypothetical protein